MSLLLNHPITCQSDLDAYYAFLNKCSATRDRTPEHGEMPPEVISFPGLVITLVDTVTDKRKDFFSHTILSKTRLLIALGLGQEEVKYKLEVGNKSFEQTPENLEDREI